MVVATPLTFFYNTLISVQILQRKGPLPPETASTSPGVGAVHVGGSGAFDPERTAAREAEAEALREEVAVLRRELQRQEAVRETMERQTEGARSCDVMGPELMPCMAFFMCSASKQPEESFGRGYPKPP